MGCYFYIITISLCVSWFWFVILYLQVMHDFFLFLRLPCSTFQMWTSSLYKFDDYITIYNTRNILHSNFWPIESSICVKRNIGVRLITDALCVKTWFYMHKHFPQRLQVNFTKNNANWTQKKLSAMKNSFWITSPFFEICMFISAGSKYSFIILSCIMRQCKKQTTVYLTFPFHQPTFQQVVNHASWYSRNWKCRQK